MGSQLDWGGTRSQEEGRRRQSLLHTSVVLLLQIKSSMFHSAAIFGEGGAPREVGESYHCFFSRPAVVSPCEVTFEFTIPLRKAINSQINISPSPSLFNTLSLSHMDVQAIEKTKEIALRKRLYC